MKRAAFILLAVVVCALVSWRLWPRAVQPAAAPVLEHHVFFPPDLPPNLDQQLRQLRLKIDLASIVQIQSDERSVKDELAKLIAQAERQLLQPGINPNRDYKLHISRPNPAINYTLQIARPDPCINYTLIIIPFGTGPQLELDEQLRLDELNRRLMLEQFKK